MQTFFYASPQKVKSNDTKNREVLLKVSSDPESLTLFTEISKNLIHILSQPECRKMGTGIFHEYRE